MRARASAAVLLCALTAPALPVAAQQVLHVGFDPYPPHHFVDEAGAPSGAAITRFRSACEAARLDCRFQVLPRERLVDALTGGGVDAGLSFVEGPGAAALADRVFFTAPVFFAEVGFFTSAAGPSPLAAPGRFAVVAVGPESAELARGDPEPPAFAQFRAAPSAQRFFQRLAGGRLDVEEEGMTVFMNAPTGRWFLSAHELGARFPAFHPVAEVAFRAAFSKMRAPAALVARFDRLLIGGRSAVAARGPEVARR